MIEALGYVGVRSDKLEDWASFGSRWLGLQLVERTGSTLRFRMDDRKQRIMVANDQSLTGERSAALFGWEVADGAALDRLAARLEAKDVPVARMSGALTHERRVREGIAFRDPAGNVLEAFHGAEVATDPFLPGRAISGFRTGPLGMGHSVLRVKHLPPMIAFYQDTLGLKLTDYALAPFVAYFFHANPRHHSVALIESDRDAIHHLMVELCSLDDVGQTYDMALAEPGRIGTTLGRHTNDHMTSFYATTPSDFLLEYGWGGRTIDQTTWQSYEMHYGTSLWGHERSWLPPDKTAEARALRAKAAADAQREPLQVMPGNHVLSHGVCPWWDKVKAGAGRS